MAAQTQTEKVPALPKAKLVLRKAKGKHKDNKNLLRFDLLYQLSFMSVVAASGVPRNKVFEKAAELPCAGADYFKKIDLVQKRLQYDYARACRMVGEGSKEAEVRALLLRFSTALTAGESEANFLSREAASQIEAYNNDYQRKLEGLKMWADAYVSLVLSAVLIIIISIVSTMIWKLDTAFILGMAVISVGSTSIGLWLIYLESPKELVALREASSPEQKMMRKLFALTVPMTLAGGALLFMGGVNFGIILLVIAALFVPIGIVANIDDSKIAKKDADVGAFLRTLGSVCTTVGATVKDALGRMDLNAINNLKLNVRRLHTRLTSGINPRLCWQRFISETGSETIGRSVGMFYDAIELGGDPQQAGFHAALFSTNISVLRDRRKTVSSPFRWLCLAMHASVVVLLTFITEVIMIFGKMVSGAEAAMPKVSGAPTSKAFSSFNYAGLELMHSMVIPMVLIFTVANAIAPTLAAGGSRYKIFQNLAITSAVTGICLVVLPTLAQKLFVSIKV